MEKLKNQQKNGKNKKASISIYIAFLGLTFIIILIAGVVAPIGTVFSSNIFAAGETLILSANQTIANISDSTIRAEIQNTLEEAQGATQDNITVTAGMYKYAWLAILAIGVVSAYIYSRRLVEVGGGIY